MWSRKDNGWFRFLLKRPAWYMRTAEADPDRVRLGLDVFTWIMTGVGPRPPGAWGFILEAVREQRWRGVKRLRRLLLRRPDRSGAAGWGWKEPNTHLYLEFLAKQYPGLRYIHTIRHGMDMAFSRTRGQLHQWAPFFDLTVPEAEPEIPATFLEFWIRANRRALALGEELGPERFHLLNFDRMCTAPREEAARAVPRHRRHERADRPHRGSLPNAGIHRPLPRAGPWHFFPRPDRRRARTRFRGGAVGRAFQPDRVAAKRRSGFR